MSSPPGDFWEAGVRPLAATASCQLFTVNLDVVPVRQPAERFALLVPDRMILT